MIYIVQPGDSIYKIARQFNTSAEALAAANEIEDPRLIHPGKILEIPGSIIPSDEGSTYIVQPGESLYDIAKQHGASLRELISYNRIPAPYMAYPGQSLHIPMSESGPPVDDKIHKTGLKIHEDPHQPSAASGAESAPPADDKACKERHMPSADGKLSNTEHKPAEGTEIHIVQPGETLYSISKKYNASVEEVIRLNNIMRPDLIYPGLVLEIPAAVSRKNL